MGFAVYYLAVVLSFALIFFYFEYKRRTAALVRIAKALEDKNAQK